MIFDGAEVELDWDSQRAFRYTDEEILSSAIAYHLVARPLSERQSAVRMSDEEDVSGLGAINATRARPWDQVHGEPLKAVTVWGVRLSEHRYSPQAVGFSFSSGQVVVAIGMTSPLSIGDGDEVLLFDGQEWTQVITTQTND